MQPPKDSIRLRHLVDAASKAIALTSSRTRAALDEDEVLALAIVRLLEIVGEAAKHLSEETRNAYPEIPWHAIAGTRDRLIHGYFDVDLDIVWNIVANDLPELLTILESASRSG